MGFTYLEFFGDFQAWTVELLSGRKIFFTNIGECFRIDRFSVFRLNDFFLSHFRCRPAGSYVCYFDLISDCGCLPVSTLFVDWGFSLRPLLYTGVPIFEIFLNFPLWWKRAEKLLFLLKTWARGTVSRSARSAISPNTSFFFFIDSHGKILFSQHEWTERPGYYPAESETGILKIQRR